MYLFAVGPFAYLQYMYCTSCTRICIVLYKAQYFCALSHTLRQREKEHWHMCEIIYNKKNKTEKMYLAAASQMDSQIKRKNYKERAQSLTCFKEKLI